MSPRHEIETFLCEACPDPLGRKYLMFHLALYLVPDADVTCPTILWGASKAKDSLVTLVRLGLGRPLFPTTIVMESELGPEEYSQNLVCKFDPDARGRPDEILQHWAKEFNAMLVEELNYYRGLSV